MAKPPKASEFRVHVQYMRELDPNDDDWLPSLTQYLQVGVGVLAIAATSGQDTLVGDGIDNIQTYQAWDRWKDGVKTSDVIVAADGTRYNIRSRSNWEQRNKYAQMVLVVRDA